MRKLVSLITAAFILSAAPAAAVGPNLGTIDGPPGATSAQDVSYVTHLFATTTKTTLDAVSSDGRVLRQKILNGDWGVPVVTLRQTLGGLSHDSRRLVLADPNQPQPGLLRTISRFAVVNTSTLTLEQTIVLRGDFGYDALSPTAATLYLIQHVSSTDLSSYRVRAYDLRAGRLLKQVIADKAERGWVMSGYPVARATSANGRFVYTLYTQPDNYPFVHALDTVRRTATCIGIPWSWTSNQSGLTNATLSLHAVGTRLTIAANDGHGKRIVLDTRSYRILSPRNR